MYLYLYLVKCVDGGRVVGASTGERRIVGISSGSSEDANKKLLLQFSDGWEIKLIYKVISMNQGFISSNIMI